MRRPIPKKPLAKVDLSTIAEMTLSAGERELLEKGIALFNAAEFWKAHEVWEEIWQSHPEDGRFFIQGLIQLAAAFHQLRRGICRGFEIHITNAGARLELFPANFLGIDVEDLRKGIRELVKMIEEENWPQRTPSDQIFSLSIRPAVVLDPATE